MSPQPGLSRRALLGLFRRPPTEPRASVAGVVSATAVEARAYIDSAAPSVSAAPRGSAASAASSLADKPRASVAAARSTGPATEPPAFSLESFYAVRAASGQASTDGRIPVFSLREGLPVPQVRTEEAPTVRPEAEAHRTTEAPTGPLATPKSTPALGATVRVRTGHCLAWQGSFCSTCVERCPIPGAIVMDAGRPRVVAERCDGCGTCVRVCPAPLNAFELRPASTPGATSS